MRELGIPAGFFVLVNPAGLWVDLDNPSGGYPYLVNDIFRAHRWSTQEQAEDYSKMFSDREYRVVHIVSVKGEILD
jgi:hypothetical protein